MNATNQLKLGYTLVPGFILPHVAHTNSERTRPWPLPTQLHRNRRIQVRRKNRYVSGDISPAQGRRHRALDMERNIDRSGSPKPKAAVQARTFGDII